MDQFENGETTESTVDIKEYIHLVWSWAWLILLAGALAGAAAYFISMRTTPIFQAKTKLLVSSPSSISGVDPTALVPTQTMTSTYSQMLLDRPVLQGVIAELQLTTTPEDLKEVVSASKGSKLGPPPLPGFDAHLSGICSGHASALLAVGEVRLKAVSLLHSPSGP